MKGILLRGVPLPLVDWMEKMAGLNGCDGGVVGTAGLLGLETNEILVLDGGNVTRYAWTCGAREELVVHHKVEWLWHG